MTSTLILKEIRQILTFIGIQYSLGRRGSYPYGLLVGFSLFKISTIVVISDMVQTVLLLNLLGYTRQKFRRFKNRKKNSDEKDDADDKNAVIKKKDKKKRLLKWIEKYGSTGLIFIAALPYGGGALTGSIVAVSIKMDKKKAFVLITIGCIIGSMLYYLGFAGILTLFHI